jgi:FtsP/CotA-like multicopper oxidase with cupredoxin domain
MSAFTQFFVKIIRHSVTVIEVDGISVTSPGKTDGFVLAPGQRLSVVLDSDATLSGSFPIIVAAGKFLVWKSQYYRFKRTSWLIVWSIDPSLYVADPNFAHPECESTPGGDKINPDNGYNGVQYTWGCISYDANPGSSCPAPTRDQADGMFDVCVTSVVVRKKIRTSFKPFHG